MGTQAAKPSDAHSPAASPTARQVTPRRTSSFNRLVQACLDGNLDAAKAAIRDGESVNAKGTDSDGTSWVPLEAATRMRHAPVVAHLLSLGADPNGNGVMYSGARSGTPDILQQLLTAGGKVNLPSNGMQPIFAAISGNGDVKGKVRVLLGHPSLDLTAVMTDGGTPEEYARSWGKIDIVEMIQAKVGGSVARFVHRWKMDGVCSGLGQPESW